MRKLNRFLACTFVLVISLNLSYSQVTADFTANTTEGCGSLQVSFSDQSSSTDGSIVSWFWDLGNVNSTNKNPGRIYGTPGCYEICLTATDSEGNTDTECKPCFIRVYELPNPDFAASPEAGCSPLDVSFIDQSSSADGNIVEWIWGLGGSTGLVVDDGTLPEIASTYTTPDEYTISLTVTDDNGCINTISKSDFVVVSDDPVVSFSAPTTFSCTTPFIVNFTNLGDVQDMTFYWDVGIDGFPVLEGDAPPPIVYSEFGSYDVCVIGVNDITGCSDTLCLEDYIQVGNPIDFSYSTTAGCEDLSVNFIDNSLDAATDVLWDFGDTNTSTAANPNHVYTDPGCYFVTLTRTVNGCTAFETSEVCIDVYELPTVNYSNDNPIGCVIPHTVNFFSFSNTATEWLWNFGDGNTSDLPNPAHTYTGYGNYTVTLTVTNANGCTATINTDQILIQELIASIPIDSIKGCTPLDVALTQNSTSPTPITSWEWEVINNNASPPTIVSADSMNPEFVLVDTGFYEIRLIVRNSIGCVDTSSFLDQIAVGQHPDMAFTADPEESCVDDPVSFVGGTSDYTNDWLWEFGDGAFGYGETPEHEYVDTGYFDVTLYAYHHECENQLTIDSFIHVNPPIAGFGVNTFCETPFYIEMVDNSIGADSIFWDFGIEGIETDTSSEREPGFTYPFTGDFTITQYVYNFETGCEHDQTFFIQIRDIVADFDMTSPLEGCVPYTVTLVDNSQDVTSYTWTASGGVFDNPGASEPALTFSTPGKYTDIQLITTDVNGCTDTLIFQDTIYANGVNANFYVDPADGCRPLTVSFTDASSSFFGTVIDWQWSFDGGAPDETISSPTTTFEEIGVYDVRLEIIDDWGCTVASTLIDGVEVTYPLISFHADTLSCTDKEVSFTNTSNGHTLQYLWDFGDNQTSTDANPTHFYQNEGIYSVCLTATDINGCDSTLCINDYIVIANPVAALEGDSLYATCPPLIVNFDNQSLNADQFTWDFGDASGTSNLVSPPHVYAEPGTFDLTLIASFGGYCPDTLVLDDYINVEGPVGGFTFDIDSACVPAMITFYGESIDYYNYSWDFGNGDIESSSNVIADTITYEYDKVGKYVPKLILEDFNGCSRAFESPDTIQLEELVLDYIVTDSILCTGEDNTTFINLSNSSLPISDIEWIFDGGNPGTSSSFEPVITYDSAGVYDVVLISSNGFCTDTLIHPAAIKVGETPIAAFAMSDTIGCPPWSIDMTDLSTVGTGFIVNWEWDYGDDDTVTGIQNPTHVYDGEGDFNINLTVTTDIGCTDETSNLVTVIPLPIVEIPEPYNMCIGNTVELEVEIISDPTGLTYYWIADPSLSCTDCLVPTANPVDTTIFYFVVNNEAGCADTSEVLVEVRPFPAPIVNITNDTTICANSIIQISADGGMNVYEYQWDTSVPGLSCYENCFNPIASPEVSSTYTVTVTNEFACETIEDVLVEVIDEYQPFAGPDRTICEGNSTQLDIDFGNDPVWEVMEGLSCAYCPDPIADPVVSTTYTVHVTTDIGCEVRDTITINVMNDEDIDAGTDDIICLGEELELDGFGEGQIVWTPDNSLSTNGVINPIASPNEPTTYMLTVTNDECVLTDSVTIDVATKAEIFAENVSICLGEDIQLEAYGTAENFSWTPAATLSDSTIANPLASPTETTTYTVTGSLGTCEDAVAEVTVTVVPGPATRLTEAYDFFPGQTVEVEVAAEEFGAFSYSWSPADLLSCVSCNNPEITPDSTTMLMVTVTDPITGCWTVDSTLVRRQSQCPPELIGVPNIFTPNNDGKNDVLELHLSPAIQPTGIDVFRVYDRWGAQVFESKDAAETWDGSYKGKRLPAGVYIYYIEADCPVGEGKIMKKGDITILK